MLSISLNKKLKLQCSGNLSLAHRCTRVENLGGGEGYLKFLPKPQGRGGGRGAEGQRFLEKLPGGPPI